MTVGKINSGPVLLLGSAGMLGRAFAEVLGAAGVVVEPRTHGSCDLADPDSVAAGFDPACPVVVNCAAWTDVDGAEAHEDEALAVNGGPGLKRLCELVKGNGALLVHFSTDYVFNGRGREPYPTDHPRDPVNAYGRTKATGEEIIEASGCEHLIVRTSWLYAPWGKNFVRTIAGLCREKDELRVVDDQRGRPTSCEHLARSIVALADAGARGIHHICDGSECTWFGFATEIARQTGSACQIRPCTTAEFPRPAPRPAYSVLDLSRTEDLIGAMPDWKTNLAGVLARADAGSPAPSPTRQRT